MFINKKIAPQPVVNASLVKSRIKRLAHAPFKVIQNGRYINKASFEVALQKVFDQLEDKNSPHFLKDKWLYGAFKTLFSNKEAVFYNNVYDKINDFYKYHPFDLEGILAATMSRFFQQHTFIMITNHPTEKFNWNAILTEGVNGKVTLARQVFASKLLEYLQQEMNDQISAKYKTFNEIVKTALRSRIVTTFQLEEGGRPYIKFLRQLSYWIDNFNYGRASHIRGQNIYDALFNENAPRTNVMQEDFINNQLKTYLDHGLDVVAKRPMLQTVLHYLFNDLLSHQKIKPIASGTLKDAHSLIESIQKNEYLPKKLAIFFPGIGKIIKRFHLYWKTSGGSDGIVIVQHSSEIPWLTTTNDIGIEFDFKLKFKFLSNFIPDLNVDDQANAFTIPVKNVLPIYDQAKMIVDKFISKIQWHSGFRNSLLWTEKDIVEWLSSINNYQDIINAQYNPHPTHISFNEWAHFSPYDLAKIDFSSLDDPNYRFEIQPLVKFVANSNNKLGHIKIYLRFSQVFKNAPQNALDKTRQVKTEDILVKDSSKILPMLALIQGLMQKKFPRGLNFDEWGLQKRSFWLHEFLDKNFNVVASKKFALPIVMKAKQELDKRSNVIAIRHYLRFLLDEINAYRNDFKQADFFSISPPQAPLSTNDFAVKQADPADSVVSLKLNVFDYLTNKQINYHAEREIRKMKVFGNIAGGPFAGIKGLDHLFMEKLRRATPLDPQVQPLPKEGLPPPPKFTFNFDNSKITIEDIRKTIESYGFKNTHYSKVIIRLQKEAKNTKQHFGRFTTIEYEVQYYDFSIGKIMSHWQYFTLSLSFNHVPPEEMQKDYDDIINRLTNKQKNSIELLTKINDLYTALKNPTTKEWRGDVERLEYKDIINQVLELIANHKYQHEEAILAKLKEIYDGKVPSKILDKLDDPDYLNVFKEILDKANGLSQQNLKRILENNQFLKFLKSQKNNRIKDLILNFLKLTNKTKYAYLGSGIALGLSGLLAGATSLRWAISNAKAKKISIKFKRNKYISIISFGAAIISISASVVLTLMFFIAKGGF